mgnify:CR=1 FL=1
MKHSSTWDLLDLADDYDNIAKEFIVHGTSGGRHLSALAKLVEIDEELLSRMPEYELIRVYDEIHIEAYTEDGERWDAHERWVVAGFEPYIPNEDEAWLFDALYGHIDGIPAVDELGW